MDHSVINWIDLTIIGLYLLVMLGIGVWFVRRVKNENDFYVAGRSLGPVVIMATVCATIVGGSAMMGRAGKAYSEGFTCVMTALPYLIGMYIFSGIAGRIHLVGKQYGARWLRAGKCSVKGHPHHPLYLRKDERTVDFDIEGYLDSL